MKNDNQPKYALEEKLSIQKNANEKICIWSEIELQGIKAKNLLAVIYDIPHGVKAEASAHRIVKAVNMHDELVEKLSLLLRTYLQASTITNKEVDKIEQLLQTKVAIKKT